MMTCNYSISPHVPFFTAPYLAPDTHTLRRTFFLEDIMFMLLCREAGKSAITTTEWRCRWAGDWKDCLLLYSYEIERDCDQVNGMLKCLTGG